MDRLYINYYTKFEVYGVKRSPDIGFTSCGIPTEEGHTNQQANSENSGSPVEQQTIFKKIKALYYVIKYVRMIIHTKYECYHRNLINIEQMNSFKILHTTTSGKGQVTRIVRTYIIDNVHARVIYHDIIIVYRLLIGHAKNTVTVASQNKT